MSVEFSIAAGWSGILLAFLTGMGIGIATRQEGWMGGYPAKARRFLRLGHISLAALGMINILAGLCVLNGFPISPLSRALLLTGLITMPVACVWSAFSEKGFFFFPVPALSLSVAGFLIACMPLL